MYQDVNRAGGIIAIMDELAKGGLVDTNVHRVDGMTLARQSTGIVFTGSNVCKGRQEILQCGSRSSIWYSAHKMRLGNSIRTVRLVIRDLEQPHTARMAVWRF